LGPVKLAFASRIAGVPRLWRPISAIAVTLRYGTIEAALARPVIPGVRS
jgi:hypothetical protein